MQWLKWPKFVPSINFFRKKSFSRERRKNVCPAHPSSNDFKDNLLAFHNGLLLLRHIHLCFRYFASSSSLLIVFRRCLEKAARDPTWFRRASLNFSSVKIEKGKISSLEKNKFLQIFLILNVLLKVEEYREAFEDVWPKSSCFISSRDKQLR